MKAILMSIKPQHVANILNKIKTLEIRKRFPSDYVGWVYIYCTKDGGLLTDNGENYYYIVESQECKKMVKKSGITINGKVVARFWCDKVEEIKKIATIDRFATDTIGDSSLLINSCLEREELHSYLQCKNGYAIHISKLEIFDKPKEISEFRPYCDRCFSINNKCLNCKAYVVDIDLGDWCDKNKLAITRAPQSWCYIEV